jgi:hypothetical protein
MGSVVSSTVTAGFLIILLTAICLTSCGQFLGFSDFPEPDVGDIKKIRLYLSDISLQKLYDSVSEDDYAPCLYREGGHSTQAQVKVRGFTSRLYPKKSFTVRITAGDSVIHYALDASDDPWLTNHLAFYAYRLAGLPAPESEGVALYINDEYLGYYTRLVMYGEEGLEEHYHEGPAELFKCYFENMGEDIPLHSRSEKKFPDDEDFSSLDTLIHNAKNLGDQSWRDWVESYVERDEIVRYMVVHDFLAVRDTETTNFYIYNHGKVLMLPWDNELSMNPNTSAGYHLGGDNLLTDRLMEDPYIRSRYNNEMQRLFINPGPENILDDIRDEAARIYGEIDLAVRHDPTYYLSYGDFLAEKDSLLNPSNGFFVIRAGQIPDPPLPP